MDWARELPVLSLLSDGPSELWAVGATVNMGRAPRDRRKDVRRQTGREGDPVAAGGWGGESGRMLKSG